MGIVASLFAVGARYQVVSSQKQDGAALRVKARYQVIGRLVVIQ